MNSFHFTLGSSRVPRVRWFTGLQCGNPWFIANTLACHCAIPDTMVAYALYPRVQRTLFSFSVSNPPFLSSLLVPGYVFASGRRDEGKMKTLATEAMEYTLSTYSVGGGSMEPIIPCSATIYLCARNSHEFDRHTHARFVIFWSHLFIKNITNNYNAFTIISDIFYTHMHKHTYYNYLLQSSKKKRFLLFLYWCYWYFVKLK